jgi:hypothetical protein
MFLKFFDIFRGCNCPFVAINRQSNQAYEINNGQTIKSKDNRINSINKTVESVASDVDDVMSLLDQVVKQLKENGIPIKVQPPEEEEPLFRNRTSNVRGRGRNTGGKGRPQRHQESYDRSDRSERSDTGESEADADDPEAQASEFRRRRGGYS